MCDRIKETDERYEQIHNKANNCVSINKKIENCLTLNLRDFRKCKDEVQELKACMENNNKNFNMEKINK